MKLKQLNWNKIPDIKVKKGSFWSGAEDQKYEDLLFFGDIDKYFPAKEAKEAKEVEVEVLK